jgi:VWFA-related protein
MRFLTGLLLAGVGVATTAWGQAPSPAPEPTIRTTTSEVLLDVVVRDKHEHIIRDLKPGDIQVLENGVPQSLRNFEFVDGRTQVPLRQHTAPQPAAATAQAPAAGPTVNELRDISLVSIVIADLDPRGRKLAQSALDDFIKNEVGPRTYVGVFWLRMGGITVAQNYTDNAEKIASAVNWAVNRVSFARPSGDEILPRANNGTGATSDSDPTAGNGQNGPVQGGGANSAATAAVSGPAATIQALTEAAETNELHDVYQDSLHYLVPLQRLIQAQAEIPGRKVVLFFSSGLPVHANTVELLNSVISTANRANVTVYAGDTRDYTQSDLDLSRRMLSRATNASRRQQLSGAFGGDQTVTPDQVLSIDLAENSIHADSRGNMRVLAEGTGGELLPPSLDMREPLRRAMEDVHTHYELAYSPTDAAADGTFRKIEVRVTRPGARVFARSGYYALPVIEGQQVYPFEMATLKALNTKPMLHQFDFHVGALQFRPGADRMQMEYVFQAPMRDLAIVKEGSWAKVHVGITALVKDEQGQVVEKISKDIPYEVPANKTAELQRGVVSFAEPFRLPPGRYALETAVVDRQSGKASVNRAAMVVEQASGLSVSDVAMVRRVDPTQGQADRWNPLQSQGGTITPELSDVVQSEAGRQVRLYAVAYPPAPVDSPVETNVQIWRDGKLVMRSPSSEVRADANGAASMMVSVPTEKFPAGQYEAHLSFEYKGQTVTRTVPFVLRPTGGTVH